MHYTNIMKINILNKDHTLSWHKLRIQWLSLNSLRIEEVGYTENTQWKVHTNENKQPEHCEKSTIERTRESVGRHVHWVGRGSVAQRDVERGAGRRDQGLVRAGERERLEGGEEHSRGSCGCGRELLRRRERPHLRHEVHQAATLGAHHLHSARVGQRSLLRADRRVCKWDGIDRLCSVHKAQIAQKVRNTILYYIQRIRYTEQRNCKQAPTRKRGLVEVIENAGSPERVGERKLVALREEDARVGARWEVPRRKVEHELVAHRRLELVGHVAQATHR